MEKGTTVAQIAEVARRLREAGVKVGFFLQFGLPRRDARRHRVDIEDGARLPARRHWHVGLVPAAGHIVLRAGQGPDQGEAQLERLGRPAMLYDGPYPTAFYRQLYVVLHKQFRSRNYRDELLAMRHPREITRQRVRRAAKLTYYTISLPLERWRLDRIARQPHQALAPIMPDLDLEAASVPSPQVE